MAQSRSRCHAAAHRVTCGYAKSTPGVSPPSISMPDTTKRYAGVPGTCTMPAGRRVWGAGRPMLATRARTPHAPSLTCRRAGCGRGRLDGQQRLVERRGGGRVRRQRRGRHGRHGRQELCGEGGVGVVVGVSRATLSSPLPPPHTHSPHPWHAPSRLLLTSAAASASTAPIPDGSMVTFNAHPPPASGWGVNCETRRPGSGMLVTRARHLGPNLTPPSSPAHPAGSLTTTPWYAS
jgi:hypothetical protein